MKIALFLGYDFYSYTLAHDLAVRLAENSIQTHFLFTNPNAKFNTYTFPDEIHKLMFYERTLYRDYLLPYLAAHPNAKNTNAYLTPDDLIKKLNTSMINIDDVNSEQTLHLLKKLNVELIICLRCAQKFGQEILNYFQRGNENYFWNLHFGILPQYRGVMPTFNSMLNSERQIGSTLHRITEKFDAGPIVGVEKIDIDYSRSVLYNHLRLIEPGVKLALEKVSLISANKSIPSIMQNESVKGYYTFPTHTEILALLSKGLKFYEKKDVQQLIKQRLNIKLDEIIDLNRLP